MGGTLTTHALLSIMRLINPLVFVAPLSLIFEDIGAKEVTIIIIIVHINEI